MDVSSKMTLYDMLAMVIPGFLLLLMLQLTFCGNFCIAIPGCENSLITGTLIFIASYVVGMIYNKISFTNIKWILNCLSKKCYLVDKIAEYVKLTYNFRNNKDRISKEGHKFEEKYKNDKEDKENDPYNLHNYYKAYYVLMEKNCLNSIPVLEAHVAFLRNMIPVVILYIFPLLIRFEYIFGKSSHLCNFIAGLIVIAIAIVIYRIMIKTQEKVYYLVWEGIKYLDDNKEEKTDNQNIN